MCPTRARNSLRNTWRSPPSSRSRWQRAGGSGRVRALTTLPIWPGAGTDRKRRGCNLKAGRQPRPPGFSNDLQHSQTGTCTRLPMPRSDVSRACGPGRSLGRTRRYQACGEGPRSYMNVVLEGDQRRSGGRAGQRVAERGWDACSACSRAFRTPSLAECGCDLSQRLITCRPYGNACSGADTNAAD